jgi:hypothetical protein
MSDKLRAVNTRFWEDPFIEGLNPTEKLLFLYLLTNPLTNLLGIYEITIKRICYDTGMTKESVEKGLKSFETVNKALIIDNYVVLPNFLKNQSLNENMKTGVVKLFKTLPNSLREKLLGNDYLTIQNDYITIRNGLLKLKGKGKDESEIESERTERPDFNFSFVEVEWKSLFEEWLLYKKSRKEYYKTQQSIEACYRNLKTLSRNDINIGRKVLDKSMGNNYQGLVPVDENKSMTPASDPKMSTKYLPNGTIR